MLSFALSDHYATAELVQAAVNMAPWPPRRKRARGDLPHRPLIPIHRRAFVKACKRLDIVQSMGRVGSTLDNAHAELYFSTLDMTSPINYENTYQTT